MKIVLTPNPYRDKQFRTVQQARKILEGCGVQTATCLPFDVDRDYELPKSIEFQDLNREIKDADMLVCFGGDGTILHASKLATAHNLPILGINIGTMGFIAELEAGELELLRRLPAGDYTIEPRSMIDVTVTGANGQRLLHETALNDAVVTKGAIARVVQVSVYCDNVEATSFSGDGVIIASLDNRVEHRLFGRLHRLFHVCWRTDRRAAGKKPDHFAHLRARDAGKNHRRLSGACDFRQDRKNRQAQRLPLRRRRQSVPTQHRRRHHHEGFAEGDEAGAAQADELLRNSQQKIHRQAEVTP